MEHTFGKMVLNMKATGKTINHVVMENLSIMMVIFLKVNGKTEKQMDMEFKQMKITPDMKGNG